MNELLTPLINATPMLEDHVTGMTSRHTPNYMNENAFTPAVMVNMTPSSPHMLSPSMSPHPNMTPYQTSDSPIFNSSSVYGGPAGDYRSGMMSNQYIDGGASVYHPYSPTNMNQGSPTHSPTSLTSQSYGQPSMNPMQ